MSLKRTLNQSIGNEAVSHLFSEHAWIVLDDWAIKGQLAMEIWKVEEQSSLPTIKVGFEKPIFLKKQSFNVEVV